MAGKSTALIFLGLGAVVGYLVRATFERHSASDKVLTVANAPIIAPLPRSIENVRPTSTPSESALFSLRELATRSEARNVQEVLSAINNLNANEFEQAFDLMKNFRGEDKTFLLRSLSRRWAELDPFGAARFLEKTRDMGFARTLLNEAAPKLVQQDAQGALDLLSSAKNPLFRILTAHAVLGELAKVDPNRATSYLASHPELRRYDDIYRQVARSYAQVAPMAAVEWAEALPSLKLKEEAFQQAWTAWAEADPAGAAAALQPKEKILVEESLASALAASWSAKDPKAARDWIESLSDARTRDRAWQRFTISLDRFGPEQALELINSITSERGRTAIASSVASQMADEQNISTAVAFAERLPSGEARTQVLRSLVDRWAPNDPSAAVNYAAAQPEDQTRTELLKRAVGLWGVQDPEAALAWAKERPAGHERDEIANDALRAVREFDPARAMSWLELIDNPSTRNHAASEVIGEIARSDGAAAAQMAGKLSEEAQPQAYHSVIRGWAFNDHEAAAHWINTLPSGAARDSAIQAYVTVIDGMDAALATRWAMAIEEPQLKDQSLSLAFGRWFSEKPGPAQAWLDSLDPALRAKLQKTAVR